MWLERAQPRSREEQQLLERDPERLEQPPRSLVVERPGARPQAP